ncbi:MAG: helix-turn-helix domain-containing protein [Verrucomicrobiales bacterium]|nr:helix-turn-helix domain-containing protein [Verrucomicrobiales bacterium]
MLRWPSVAGAQPATVALRSANGVGTVRHGSSEYIPAAPEQEAWRRLVALPSVRELQVAFTCATGVALALVPASGGASAPADEIFCVRGCLGSPSGTICQRQLLRAERRALTRGEPVQYACPSGLLKILVPVFLGGRHVGSLLAGPFALQSLDEPRLERLLERLERHGLGERVEQLKNAWRFSPLLSPDKCRALHALLQMFARHLEECGRQLLASAPPVRSPMLEKIEAFLAECPDGQVSLKEVATRVNLSPCHFCTVFKKQTGMTFSQYRLLEKARELLADPARRISDVAFEAGFESIPYFNRAFRRWFNCSPTEYRARLTQRNPGQSNPNPGVAPNETNGFND